MKKVVDSSTLLAHVEMLEIMLESIGDLNNMFKYNLLTEKVEIFTRWWKPISQSLEIDDYDFNQIRLFLEKQCGRINKQSLREAIEYIARENSYHPIRQIFNNLEWDGVRRLDSFLNKYLGAEINQYNVEVFKTWLLCAVARVYEPGIKADITMILVDEQQGTGKSSICRMLALHDSFFCDDVNSFDEKACQKLKSHFIIELAEMRAVVEAKSIESVRSFLSRQVDTYRLPYKMNSQDYPRSCVFVGTTNALDALPMDYSGNRRFFPILCSKNRAEVHPLDSEEMTRTDILNIYAEVLEIYRSGDYMLTLPKDIAEEAEKIKKQFEPEQPMVGIIQQWLDDHPNIKSVCSCMLYNEALRLSGKASRKDLREINDIMNHKVIGWEKHPTSDHKVRFEFYGKQRAWDRIPVDVNTAKLGIA